MAMSRIRVIINPMAGAGAARRAVPHILETMRRFDLSCELAITSGPGDATRLANTAFDDGLDMMVVVGGDGTLNEVIQAYLGANGAPRPGPILGMIPIGTGGDFRRTAGIPRKLSQAIERIRSGNARPVDLGVLDLVDDQGVPTRRAFINVTSFGVGGLTDRLVNQSPKWLGGKASFFVGAARAALAYKNVPTVIEVDSHEVYRGRLFNGVIANGRYFGGGMLVAPKADVRDGMFDVIVIGDLTFREALQMGRTIYRGKHTGLAKVEVFRGSSLRARPIDPNDHVLLDVDGETPGRLPIEANLIAGALKVVS